MTDPIPSEQQLGPARAGVRVGVDVGGTFTDLVALVDGALVTRKVPSTPQDPSIGMLQAIEAAELDPGSVEVLSHGTTVATNTLLQRRGARTALVTTAGFRDLLEIGRQNRAELYDLTATRPEPLVPRSLRFPLAERMAPDGVLTALDEDHLGNVVNALAAASPEAVAVCLLFGFAHPEHEQRVAAAIRAALPDIPVSTSSTVLPEFREFERCSTTVADAYLTPKLGAYLARLTQTVQSRGLPDPLVMQSSGGVVTAEQATGHAVSFLLSGPAAGVVGAAHTAAGSGYDDVLSIDMGGTSTDVAAVSSGQVHITTESEVAGVPIKSPMVDVHTVSAGGGSIAWVDAGGVLRIGPHSAGAEPGPVAYDRGGTRPTVTDANLMLGYLGDDMQLGGAITLRRDKAERVITELGTQLGLGPAQTAEGIIRVANTEMSRALRVSSVQRGLDPRRFALVAFGGAGPLHACALAEELGMRTVLVPKASGVLSALGLAISDLRRDYVTAVIAVLSEAGDRLERAFTDMIRLAEKDLPDPRLQRYTDLRYRGQSFELTVSADQLDTLIEQFHAAHEQRYGYRMATEPIEVVNARLVATVPVPKPQATEPPSEIDSPSRTTRWVYLDQAWRDVPVYDRNTLGRGSTLTGPAVLELAEATCLVRPGWVGRIDDTGTLLLELP
jgi:N-methylhydantoinase A